MKQYLPKGYIIRGLKICVSHKDINTLRICMCTMFEKGMYLNSEMAKRMLRDINLIHVEKQVYFTICSIRGILQRILDLIK